jgi:hypothetical protein
MTYRRSRTSSSWPTDHGVRHFSRGRPRSSSMTARVRSTATRSPAPYSCRVLQRDPDRRRNDPRAPAPGAVSESEVCHGRVRHERGQLLGARSDPVVRVPILAALRADLAGHSSSCGHIDPRRPTRRGTSNDDLDVASEGIQEIHQSFDGKTLESIIRQSGNLRLIDSWPLRRRRQAD